MIGIYPPFDSLDSKNGVTRSFVLKQKDKNYPRLKETVELIKNEFYVK